jgi:hypothetical protein
MFLRGRVGVAVPPAIERGGQQQMDWPGADATPPRASSRPGESRALRPTGRNVPD